MYVAFIEPCFGTGHNLSLICQMTSEDIKHQLIIIMAVEDFTKDLGVGMQDIRSNVNAAKYRREDNNNNQ